MKNLLLFALLCMSQWLHGQTFAIQGKITDDANNTVPGATVTLQYPWGEKVQIVSTGPDGAFHFAKVAKGGYAIEVTAMGFAPFKKQVTVVDKTVDVGVWILQPDPMLLKEVKIEGTMPLAKQNGDTTEYNAGAFKVMKDANADELIEKLPSVTVENGTVKAQGESVNQVLVDGKPFFGNDPTAALKAIPAEVVEKVQIFDQQSDQSQFTGFSDGNTTKTINIVTKTGMRNGQFGKVYGGYGYQDKYQLGGNINVFDGARRISFIGMSNNINVQNFAVEDILGVMGVSGGGGGMRPPMGMMGGGGGGRSGGGGGGVGDFMVRPSGGIAVTHAIGVNYSDKWGAKVDVSASYFFNFSNTNSEKSTYRQFFDNDATAEVYDETNTANADNLNHRFNARMEYKIDSMNSILWRPRFTVQQNDGVSNTIGSTTLAENLLSATQYAFNSDLTGINFNNTLLWRHKFAKKGRTLSFDISSGYAPKNGHSLLQSQDAYYYGMPRLDSLDQKASLDVNSWNAAGNLEYTEPLGKNGQIILNYRGSFQQESSDKYTYDFFAPDGTYTALNEDLTNVFSNDYFTHQAGVGYGYNLGRELNLNVRANAQWAELTNLKSIPFADTFAQTFFNVLPSAQLRYSIDKQKNIRINYRSNTRLPSVDQLQDVVNNSNPLQLSVGNPDLVQATQHNLFLNYQASNTDKATTLFAMVGGGFTMDYIANSTYLASSDNPIFAKYNVQPGAQISRPVNLDGYYNLRSFVSYGMPVKWIRTNLNIDASYNYSRTPGLLNDVENFAGNQSVGVGLTLSSNISTKIDFSISARPTWSKVTNTLQTNSNSEYLSQTSRLKFNWIIIEGFVLRTDLSHQLYSGLSDSYNQNYWIWNLGVGKKVFKNDRGEITLSVNDLLNQNRNIQRTVTETYIEDVQTNALRQFVMLSFSYNLRNFNTGKAAPERAPSDEPWRMWGPPPQH